MINPAVCSLVPHFKDVHYNGIAGGLEKRHHGQYYA